MTPSKMKILVIGAAVVVAGFGVMAATGNSAEKTFSVDAAKVDEYNSNLYSSAREVNSIARDHGFAEWETTYIQYLYSNTTDDPSMKFGVSAKQSPKSKMTASIKVK